MVLMGARACVFPCLRGPPTSPSQVRQQVPDLGSLRGGLHFINGHIKALVYRDSFLCGFVVWHLLSFKTLLANVFQMDII